jgi:hypothetical protein
MYPEQDTRPAPQGNFDMFGVPDSPQNNFDDFYGQMTDGSDDSSENQGSPAPQGQPGNAGANGSPQSNDDVRYQYWQSQHDQLKNKYEQLESEYRAIKQQVEAKSKEPEPEEEVFPDPPPPPQKPYGYSYQEAMSDPSSDSARYMIAMSEYNQNMNQYNLLRTQWVEARNQERLQAFKEQSEAEKKAMQQRSQMSEQVNRVISTVQQKFGVDYNVALDFVNTMSDNSSITVDNLFELYKMKKGIAQGQNPMGRYAPAPPSPTEQYNPWGVPQPQASPDFQQRQRAQSVPPTMGVHNAQVQQQEDPLMAAFRQTIKNSNNQNIY